MTCLALLGVVLLLVGAGACAKPKVKPLVPLALEAGVKPQAVALTEQGTQAYQARQFDEAKNYFSQAVAVAPQSGPAHYNYGLALNALGETEQARQQFLDAANLAPGDKVIWDSPALRPFGSPDSPKVHKEHPMATGRPGIGSGPR
ncbi:MAG: tetratricopeptide repeat protein [Nitrospirae bacterium]|nr:tetratricopeptide repeat protein [Nitrospirota bacterium]